jgi:hypothetical protein
MDGGGSAELVCTHFQGTREALGEACPRLRNGHIDDGLEGLSLGEMNEKCSA